MVAPASQEGSWWDAQQHPEPSSNPQPFCVKLEKRAHIAVVAGVVMGAAEAAAF